MSRIRTLARDPSRAALTLALLALGLGITACGDAGETASPSPASFSSLLGYWRPVEVSEDAAQLLLIARQGESYTIDLPPFYAARELVVAGERLELREEAEGELVYLAAFSLKPGDDRLTLAHYMSAPFSGDPQDVTLFERAEGSDEDLADELRKWWANTTAQGQVETLGNAVALWRNEFGRLPTRAEMRSDGAFWQWPQAPEMVNAFTGAPVELGKGLGEFSYEPSAAGASFKLTVHLFGGGESSWTQG